MAIESQSAPGQFAAAIKRAAQANAPWPGNPAAIDHGHGDEGDVKEIMSQLVPTAEDIAKVTRPHPRQAETSGGSGS
jgi:hypothetical protein